MLFLNLNIPFISEFTIPPNLVTLTALLVLILIPLLCSHLFTSKPSQTVFLVDFACYKPPDSQKYSRDRVLNRARELGQPKSVLNMMAKVLHKAGLGDSSYVAETILSDTQGLDISLEAAKKESQNVIFGAIDALLAKTEVKCSEIGILIVNCTVFNVAPSLCSIIVNRYKLREDICSYNLSGMGCSAGLLAIGLAKQLLRVHQNACALIVSTENITCGIYSGTDPSKHLTNCLFRIGGSAILLSNKSSHRQSSKYELTHAVQTNTEDSEGITGVTINKDLLIAANFAIKQHLQTLGTLILPLSEQFLFLKNFLIRRLNQAEVKPYIPQFNKCVEHFFSHVGGKQVLDELQKSLGFSDTQMEASRMTLHRFGNTSSSSIWNALTYAEAKGRMKMGDKVWQIAFGSGFKCNSVIWRVLRDVLADDEKNPWMSDVDDYPIDLDANGSLDYLKLHGCPLQFFFFFNINSMAILE
ncbi:Very-long-chain 3-oxoacyl-CoA synthase [Handroanthus impetiginosus]|uniref:3-ketoacyl-CoA synthase n=1 Tax=Handroanthus impetiginosus TaxID=429701 RepID=A0A2G9HEH7_9LAMI|nr:Very-long-chain 3-oxoacyl-CoA synthase [Handroanthus impetiginosus]